MRGKPLSILPYMKVYERCAKVLAHEGYINSYSRQLAPDKKGKMRDWLYVENKFNAEGKPAIRDIAVNRDKIKAGQWNYGIQVITRPEGLVAIPNTGEKPLLRGKPLFYVV